MGKWLDKYKNHPETRTQSTDKADTAQVIDFASEAEKAKTRLKQYGIAKIHSDTLEEDVYWARDEQQAAKAPRDAVVYTMNELRELARGSLTRDDLKRLHAAKKLFNGRIVNSTGGKNE